MFFSCSEKFEDISVLKETTFLPTIYYIVCRYKQLLQASELKMFVGERKCSENVNRAPDFMLRPEAHFNRI